MRSVFDDLTNALDIEPENIIREPSELRKRLDNIVDSDDNEYEIAKGNLIELMKEGADAIAECKSLAMQTQHARFFENMTLLLKTMVEANRELLEIKKLDKSMSPEAGDNKSPVNNILVCSTADLARMIESQGKK